MVKSRVFLKFITTYVSILMLPVILFSILIYTSFVNSLKQEIMVSTARMLMQISDTMDKYQQDLKSINGQISLNSNIAPVILSQDIKQIGVYPIYQCIRELSNYRISNSIISNLFIIMNDSDLVISDLSQYNINEFLSRVYLPRDMEDDRFNSGLLNLSRPLVFNTRQVYSEGKLINVISYAQALPVNNFSHSTTLIMTIKESVICQMIQKVLGEYSGQVYIFDAQSNIVLSTSLINSPDIPLIEPYRVKQLAGSLNYDGNTAFTSIDDNFIVSSVRSDVSGWQYIAVIKSNEVLQKVEYIKRIHVLAIMLILVLGLLLAYSFSRGNYSKLKHIIDVIPVNNMEESGFYYKNEWHIINYAITKYINENASLQKKLTDQMPIIRNNFFMHLLKGDMEDLAAVQSMVDFLKLEVNYKCFSVMLICINDYKQFVNMNSEPTQGVIRVTIANVAEEFCKKVGSGYTVELAKDKIAVITAFNENVSDCSKLSKGAAEEICSFLEKNFKLKITIALSNTYSNLLDISKACSEAEYAIGYRIIKGTESVIVYSELGERFYEGYNYSFEKESQIVKFLRLGDIDSIITVLQEIVYDLKSKPVSLEVAKCIYFEIINTAIKSLNELGVSIRYENYLPNILSKETLDDVYKEVCSLYAQMCEQVQMAKHSKNKELRDRIIQYLSNNYMNRDLSVEFLANEFDVSLSHMSRFFNEQIGCNFVDYLHSLRLSKAKQLLASSEKSISEIAEETGYNSVYNFTRVFKRYEKISPSEYRLSMRMVTGGGL